MHSLVRTLLLLLAFGIACSSGRPIRPQRTSTDQYLISNAELESTRQTNLYDAIRHLRPFWFTRDTQNRGDNAVAVYLDDQLVGGLGSLRRLPIHITARARYMSPNEAQVRFGSNNGFRPAILVESARR